MLAKKKVKIALLWHGTQSANLGVDALTKSEIALLTSACAEAGAEPSFVVIGWGRDEGGAIPTVGLNLKRLTGLDPTVWRTVKSCDFVVDIGEGDSFTDIYGLSRLLFMWATKEMAFLLNKPLILAPQTIGPFTTAIGKILSARVLLRASCVVTRDNLSTAYVDSRGLRVRVHEASDVAFSLPFNAPARSAVRSKPTVGINVSGLLWSGGYSGKNQFGLKTDYRMLMERVVDFFLTQGCEVILVPHVQPENFPEEDDRCAAKELARKFPSCQVVGPFHDAIEAKSKIAEMDFFCGARMHACIAAFSAGVPVLPLAYSRKFSGLFGSLGYKYVADCTELTTDQAFSAVEAAWNQRASLRVAVEVGGAEAQRRLRTYVQELVRVIKGVYA